MKIPRFLAAAVAVAGAVALSLYLFNRDPSRQGHTRAKTASDGMRPIKVIKPVSGLSGQVEARQVCLIEPFQKADLNTRIAGIVSKVTKDIGDRVSKGELLLELDTPDILAEIGAKEQAVIVRQAEARASKAGQARVEAGLRGIKGKIIQSEAMVRQAEAILEFRTKRLLRYNALAKEDTVTADLVDEQTREHKAAVESVEAAKAAVDQARAMLSEKEAEIQSSAADVELKSASVELARLEVAKARSQLALASIVAPFDGIVAKRAVDPGDFVSAPSGVSRDPMLVVISETLQGIAHFPDTLSGKIGRGTSISLRLDSVPGKSWSGGITRVSPVVSTSDRTITVEIDIHGASEKLVSNHGITIPRHDRDLIMPGSAGEINIFIGNVPGMATIPSSAIVSRGGQTVIMLAENGFVRIRQAQVVMNDGKSAIVRIRESTKENANYRNLTTDDRIIVSRQADLSEGEKIAPVEEKP